MYECMYVCIVFEYVYTNLQKKGNNSVSRKEEGWPEYIHKYIHTSYIHAYIHTYIHTYIRTYMHAYIHTYIHTYMHTYIHTSYIHTYIPVLFYWVGGHAHK